MSLEQPVFEKIYREEAGRILATLIRLLGDFDLAEEMTHEAFAVALEHWSTGRSIYERVRVFSDF
jgi:predicted RNA polymerase sigma factor